MTNETQLKDASKDELIAVLFEYKNLAERATAQVNRQSQLLNDYAEVGDRQQGIIQKYSERWLALEAEMARAEQHAKPSEPVKASNDAKANAEYVQRLGERLYGRTFGRRTA